MVAEGDTVKAGDPCYYVSAMKMETVVTAPSSGVIAAVREIPGQYIDAGAIIIVLQLADDASVESASDAPSTNASNGISSSAVVGDWAKHIEGIQARRSIIEQHAALPRADGKPTAKQRILSFVDRGSFLEVGPISGVPEYDSEGRLDSYVPGNYVLGYGKVDGRRCILGAEDFTISGGSPNLPGMA